MDPAPSREEERLVCYISRHNVFETIGEIWQRAIQGSELQAVEFLKIALKDGLSYLCIAFQNAFEYAIREHAAND
jgi:hypothetical protein